MGRCLLGASCSRARRAPRRSGSERSSCTPTGASTPQLLPKQAFAPIHFQGYGEIKTTDGSVPPALQHVKLEFDHDGRLTTAGLAVCQAGRARSGEPAAGAPALRRRDRRHGHIGAAVALPSSAGSKCARP